jgi:hypothetical protein
MTDNNVGNGTNGDKLVMKRDIKELSDKIDRLGDRFERVEKFFSPGGLCEISRRKTDGHGIHIIIQYGLFVLILVAILKS